MADTSDTRDGLPAGLWGPITAGLGVATALMAVVWSASIPLWLGIRIYSEQLLLCVLAASIAMTFLGRRPNGASGGRASRLDVLLALAALIWGAALSIRFPVISQAIFYHPDEALAFALVGLPLLVEAVRRTMGWALLAILAAVCAYALFADQFTGPLQNRAIKPERLVTFLILDSAALAGQALYIAVAVVFPFLILAQLLLATGGAGFFSDISLALMGRSRGGAGKISIMGSAFFGSVSGSAVSNVASTGAITIPLMKQGGYRPHTAAGIESAASTGGQLMPPIMGAAAFLLAENLQVPYGEVMLAALIPSVLYYIALFVFADLEAARRGIARVEESRIPRAMAVLARGWFVLAPFAVLLIGLFAFNQRPETAALYAVATLFLLSLIRTYDGPRIRPRVLLQTLSKAGRSGVEIVLICAVAGMIIGLFARSGLSFGMSHFLIQLGEASLPLLLGVTAAVCILLGMGLPTVGVYLLLATLAAPPLVQLGLEPMAAHMFVLYFGMLSMITPPVAIAAFVAANMAGAPPMRTGFEAVRIGWTAYVVPFLFAGSPALLMTGGPVEVAAAVATAVAGVWLATCGVVGWLGRTLAGWERLAAGACGLAALIPPGAVSGGVLVNLVGLAGGAGLWALTRRTVAPLRG